MVVGDFPLNSPASCTFGARGTHKSFVQRINYDLVEASEPLGAPRSSRGPFLSADARTRERSAEAAGAEEEAKQIKTAKTHFLIPF